MGGMEEMNEREQKEDYEALPCWEASRKKQQRWEDTVKVGAPRSVCFAHGWLSTRGKKTGCTTIGKENTRKKKMKAPQEGEVLIAKNSKRHSLKNGG